MNTITYKFRKPLVLSSISISMKNQKYYQKYRSIAAHSLINSETLIGNFLILPFNDISKDTITAVSFIASDNPSGDNILCLVETCSDCPNTYRYEFRSLKNTSEPYSDLTLVTYDKLSLQLGENYLVIIN